MALKVSDKAKKIFKYIIISVEVIAVAAFLFYLYRKLSGLKVSGTTSAQKEAQVQTQAAVDQLTTTIKTVETHQQNLLAQRAQTMQSKAQRDKVAASIFTVTDNTTPVDPTKK